MERVRKREREREREREGERERAGARATPGLGSLLPNSVSVYLGEAPIWFARA
jgi:hypothetical protein